MEDAVVVVAAVVVVVGEGSKMISASSSFSLLEYP